MKTYVALIALPLIVLLSGCIAGAPLQTISSNPLLQVATTDESGIFAADQACCRIAFVREGLLLTDMESGTHRIISEARPSALAWNAGGELLVAAYPAADYETRLVQYSAQGEPLHDILLPVALNQIYWSVRGDLLLSGFILKNYLFGSNLQQVLYRIVGEKIAETVLSDTTLDPATVKRLSPIMKEILPVVFSPQGDELVYAELHDPPEFSPYLQLRYQNWQLDKNRSLQQIPLQILKLDWDRDDLPIKVTSATGIHEISLWPVVDQFEKPVVAGYTFVNGRLYDGDELLADWGAGARLQFLKGGRFLLYRKERLYLGDGLREQLTVGYNERLWNLRRWRFEELITADEYQKLMRENQK